VVVEFMIDNALLVGLWVAEALLGFRDVLAALLYQPARLPSSKSSLNTGVVAPDADKLPIKIAENTAGVRMKRERRIDGMDGVFMGKS
jgi:hypothetical protein